MKRSYCLRKRPRNDRHPSRGWIRPLFQQSINPRQQSLLMLCNAHQKEKRILHALHPMEVRFLHAGVTLIPVVALKVGVVVVKD